MNTVLSIKVLLELNFSIMILGLAVIREDVILVPELLKKWIFTILGVMGLIYTGIAGSLFNCFLFVGIWFLTVCFACVVDAKLNDIFS